ncbi:MAG: hypothetical protein IPL46_34605 [Saprospiraceae bacterium]|nr:hypothetical protein [Saprospiraceae bacterium]
MKTIMQNLTSNAVRVLQDKKMGQIKWEAYRKADKVYLAVTDNGPGLSSEQARALFKNETSINLKTGLGFHIIRDLAKKVGCEILLTAPQAGMGARFELIME